MTPGAQVHALTLRRRFWRRFLTHIICVTLIFPHWIFGSPAFAAFFDGSSTRLPAVNDLSYDVAVGDVDGDSDLDLFVANAGQSSLLVNNGDGVFEEPAVGRLPPLDATVMGAAFGDLDGDADLDLILAVAAGQNRVLINDGTGVFSDQTATRLPADSQLSMAVALGDVDNDGDTDLVVANKGGQNRLLINDGSGQFADQTDTRLPAVSGPSYGALLVDVNGNGFLDLLVANHDAQNSLLVNNGLGQFVDQTASRLPQANGPSIDVQALDVDTDGDPDLLVSEGEAGMRLLINDGSGVFADESAVRLPALADFVVKVDGGDLDDDGDTDILLANLGQDRALLNDGNGVFSDGTDAMLPADTGRSFGLTLADVNSDLDQDAALAAPGGQNRLLVNNLTVPRIQLAVDPDYIEVGDTVTLTLEVFDEDGIASTDLTVNGEALTLAGGVATYVPTVAGDFLATATTVDNAGNTASRSLPFVAQAPDVTAPQVTLTLDAPTPLVVGQTVTLQVAATDDRGIASRSLLINGTAVALDTAGNASYTTTSTEIITAMASATDLAGNEGTDQLTFAAVGDTTAPTLALDIEPRTVAIGDSVILTVSATDDIGVAATSLEINGSPVTLDASGRAVYTPPALGEYVAIAGAEDATGNVATVTELFQAADPASDTTPPTVALTAPEELAEITGFVDITGTASDDTLVRYTLAYAPSGTEAYTTFASGNAEVLAGTLGTLDTTLLVNGMYDIRLTAEDVAGQTAFTDTVYLVVGQAKVGIVRLSFDDLTIPVAGIPITVTRTYDSRVKTQQDFGIGWELSIRQGSYQNNRTPGEGWQILPSGGTFPLPCQAVTESLGHMTEVRLSEREYYRFRLTLLNPAAIVGGCVADAAFEFVDGTIPGATLGIVGNTGVFHTLGSNEVVDDATFQTYDPRDVRLTTVDGRVFDLERTAGGITRIQDSNGNQLFINDNGIVHSSGKGITFTRDGQGRITRITDPMGNTLDYGYDVNGDLVSTTDQEANVTQYTYDGKHNLIDIIDPRGVRAVRTEYDLQGRMIATADAAGNRIEFTHELASRREVVRDALGNPTIYEYDERGNVVTQINALGYTSTSTYDANDNLLSETDPLSNTTNYTYDDRNNRLTETDALGHVTTYTYNSRNLVLTITDALGRVTINAYDSSGNLTSTTDPEGAISTFGYDSRGLQTSRTDALGNVTAFAYDSEGNLTRGTDALGNPTDYTYDANGNRLTETRHRTVGGVPETLVTSFAYDGNNRPVRTTHPDGSVTEMQYNVIGKQAKSVDPLGRETLYEYELLGQLEKTIYPDGTFETSGYDAAGRRTSSTDRAGRTTTYSYDAIDRLIVTTYPDGATNSSSFDAADRLVANTDARANVAIYRYDAADQRTEVTDGLGNKRRFAYDAIGNVVVVIDANGNSIRLVYDDNNRRTGIIYPDGTYDEVGYDSVGQTISETDQAGVTTQFGYDALGRLTSVTDALGQVTGYSYDEQGNKIEQKDANGNTTAFGYDVMGRRVSRTLPLGMTETMAYDLVGHLISKTDFNGHTMTYGYDAADRLISKTPDPGLGEPTVSFTYTATGQRSSMSDASGTTIYAYDSRDRLIEKVSPQGALSYTYDAEGNVTSIASGNPGGASMSYEYDALNRLSSVTDENGATTYSYDAVGNLEGFLYANGVRHRYTFDTLNRLTDLTVTSAGVTIGSYAYVLAPVGNRLSVAERSARSVQYTYDDLYRLTSETITGDPEGVNGSISYAYDPVGNRLSRTAGIPGVADQVLAYDANDRLISESYDDNGNTLNSSGRTFRYDYEGHLIELNGGELTIVYDGDGNRVAKTVGGVTTEYLVDSVNPSGYPQVLEEIENDLVVRTYTYGLDLVSQGQSVGTSFYVYDGHSSSRALIDQSGATTDLYTYDAFGKTIERVGGTDNAYLFAGEQRDFDLGLDFLRARYLEVETGRFVSRDPHEGYPLSPHSLHPYLFVEANPVNAIDPSGERTLVEVSAVGVGIGLVAAAQAAKLVGIVTAAAALACVANYTIKRGIQATGGDVGGGGPCDPSRMNRMQLQLQAGIHWHIHSKNIFPTTRTTVTVFDVAFGAVHLQKDVKLGLTFGNKMFPYHRGEARLLHALNLVVRGAGRYPPGGVEKGGHIISQPFPVGKGAFRVDLVNNSAVNGPNLQYMW